MNVDNVNKMFKDGKKEIESKYESIINIINKSDLPNKAELIKQFTGMADDTRKAIKQTGATPDFNTGFVSEIMDQIKKINDAS